MKNLFTVFLAISISTFTLSAQAPNVNKLPADFELPLKYGATILGKRQDASMKKFRDNRLGLFIHWGLYAISAGEWNGKVYNSPSSFLQKSAKITSEEWMNTLMSKWNPENFNAEEWVKTAKEMGVKYIKLVTKHHDGFCLWLSNYSKYTVGQTPIKRDIVGELAKACDWFSGYMENAYVSKACSRK